MAVQMRFQRSKAAPVVIDVGLFGPSTSVRHLGDLLRMRMERVRLSGEVDEIVLEVIQVAVTTCRQRMLFGETDACHSKAQRVGMLVDRFSGRLGRSAVFQPQLIADTQPEYAWIAVPPRIDSQTVHQSETTRSGRRNRARRQPNVLLFGRTAAGRFECILDRFHSKSRCRHSMDIQRSFNGMERITRFQR